MNSQILKKISLLLFLTILNSCNKESSEKPNIVLIVADDLGWSDLSYMGSEYYETPNIDKLASEGMIFNNMYLTTSSCSPSRNSIMTGRYPHNTGAPELHTEPPLDLSLIHI